MRRAESRSIHNHLDAPDGSGKRDTMATTVPVEVVSGDELVRDGEVPKPTVAKPDVEGGESSVLDGMRETLSSQTCRLVDLGLDVEWTIEGKRCYQLRCTKP